MATATYRVFDPLLPRAQAERMLRVCERFGGYGTYSQEASEGARANTGIILDTDSVFHGVDPVESNSPLPAMRPCMQLRWDHGRWLVHDGDAVVARYRWDEIRFSISWKAYCFADAEERRAWREHRKRPGARAHPRSLGRGPPRARPPRGRVSRSDVARAHVDRRVREVPAGDRSVSLGGPR